VGAVTRLIAHHPDTLTLAIEGVVVLVLVVLFGWIWARERRRRRSRGRPPAEMRE
jgi:uncharacterized membrane protein